MKKKIRGALLWALSLSLALTGCGGGETETDAGQNQTKFTYWVTMPAAIVSQYQSMGEMLMYQELQKRTGVEIEFIHPAVGQGSEQFTLMLASNELPDFIETNWLSYAGGPEKAIADNIIIALDDIVEECAPNLFKQLKENPEYDRQSKTDSGKYYGFPSLNVGTARGFGGLIIRSDWLTELNLEMPETIDEWENTLRAFQSQKGAETPFTGDLKAFSHTAVNQNNFNTAYGVGKGFYMEDKKVKFGPLEPGYRDWVAKMSQWYQEGLIDNDFDTNSSSNIDSKMMNGKAGAVFGYVGGTLGKYLEASEGRYDLAAAPYPVMNKGDKPGFMELQPEANTPFLTITTACKDPQSAAKWADYMYSEEGKILKNFGVEGVTYTKEGDDYRYTDLILHNDKGLSISEAMTANFRSANPSPGFNQLEGYLDQYYQLPQQKDAIKLWNEPAEEAKKHVLPPISTNMEEANEMASLSVELNTYVEEMLLKFIQGTEPIERYDAFVEKCKTMKADRLIELYQEALDRYFAR